MKLSIDLAYLCRPHPDKWFLPLKYLVEDGQELYCSSFLDRERTRTFLRKHHLLEFFDDILYTEPRYTIPITTLTQLPPLALRPKSRTKLNFVILHT